MNTANKGPEYGNTIDVAGLETNYLESGSGDPVLLLHGAGPGVTSYVNWYANIPELAKNFRVVAPDAPGFGHTERRKGQDYDMDFWARHTVDLMDALGMEKAHFVGNSFGGALTVGVATRYPDRVNKMVLMGAGGLKFEPTEGVRLVATYQPDFESMARIMREYFPYDPSMVSDELVRSRFETSMLPGHQEAYASVFAKFGQGVFNTPEEKIEQIKHQVLVLHGRDDVVVPFDCAVRYLNLLEHSDLHAFGECGHWVQIEKQDAFNKLVTDFLLS